MRSKIVLIILFSCLLPVFALGQPEVILNRYKDYLLRTSNLQNDQVEKWTSSLNESGQWSDIDYKDRELAGWKISQHLVRVRDMALDWSNPKSKNYHSKITWEKINKSLDHWISERYQSANWWHNEIGVPRYMRDIIILIRKDLNAPRLKKALTVMAQLKVHDDYVGGNLIWCADLGLHYGALTGDVRLIERCRDLILKEIRITDGEGVRPDYSFHQHGKRLQMYQYGEAFLVESMRVAWQFRQTKLAFPKDKVDILTDFVLEGWQWMARGVHTVPGTMDRSASRKGELRSADIRPLVPFIKELQPEKITLINEMDDIQNGKGCLIGFRYYPYSDFAVFHRPGFSFFLKTISNRTYGTESINRENLKGKLLHSGDAYLIRNGKEYFDLLPVWDWTALPGVTTFNKAHRIERQSSVGAVSDSLDGLSSMNYVVKDSIGKQVLSARKFWACHKDVVISLLSDIKHHNATGEVYTALDQCRWQGDVTVNNVRHTLQKGLHEIDEVKWIHHAGFAYIPLQTAPFTIQLKETSGNWTTINASETPAEVNEKVYLPIMKHDLARTNAAGYVLAFSETAKHAQKLAAKPCWEVVRNDSDCQAVQFKNGPLMAAFYSASKLSASKKVSIDVDQSCLLMLKNKSLYVSDPTHKGITVNISINNKKITIELPKDGFTKVIEIGEGDAI